MTDAQIDTGLLQALIDAYRDADAVLQIDHKPVLFVEVKRFEGVAQRRSRGRPATRADSGSGHRRDGTGR